jgi:hypothetical protein
MSSTVIHQFQDRSAPFAISLAAAAFQGFAGSNLTIGTLSPGKPYLVRSSLSSIFNQLEQLFVFHQVAFVQGDNHVRNVDLMGQQNVLSGLRHGPSGALTTRIAPSIWAAPVIMFLI